MASTRYLQHLPQARLRSMQGQTHQQVQVATFQTGSTPLYNIYAANISAYAGQTGQLLFTTHPGRDNYLDNLQFSNLPVPEPESLALLVVGGMLGIWRWKRS